MADKEPNEDTGQNDTSRTLKSQPRNSDNENYDSDSEMEVQTTEKETPQETNPDTQHTTDRNEDIEEDMEAADNQLLNTSVDSDLPELNTAQEDELLKEGETENSANLNTRLRPKSDIDYNVLLGKKGKGEGINNNCSEDVHLRKRICKT